MKTETPIIDQRIALLRRHWKNHPLWDMARGPKPGDRQQFTVAISREAGAPGHDVAREIGQRLNWPVYDREILDLIAQESGLRHELLKSIDEHDRHWLIEAIASFGRRNELSTAGFVHHLVHVMSALASQGKCIIVGRGAAACLPRATTLRVRIVADLGDRVRQIAVERNLSEDKAHEAVANIDRDRSRFVSHHFHRDVGDAHNFDMVLNASRLSPAMCADLVISALKYIRDNAAAAASAAPPAESAVVG